jgi:hypothetical protein
MLGIADRDVQLVGRNDAELGIAVLPPELVADDGDVQSAAGLGASCVARMTRAVARNSMTTIRMGMTVQESSIWVLP